MANKMSDGGGVAPLCGLWKKLRGLFTCLTVFLAHDFCLERIIPLKFAFGVNANRTI